MAKLMVIGGFLGAGKTTAMIEVAKTLKKIGNTVGLITNDQTDYLVDTQYVENHDLEVTELTGSCFCCNYPGFAERVDKCVRRTLFWQSRLAAVQTWFQRL